MNRFEDVIKRMTINPVIRNIGRVIDKKHFPGIPIFVTASPRSGTTLLLSILGAHPNIYAVPEQTYAFSRWTRTPFRRYREYPYRIDRLYREFILKGFDRSANRWCEKTPRHVEYIEKIVEFYGGSVQIIHLIRDGRDVVVSSHPTHTGRHYWVSANRWLKSVQAGWSLREKPYLHTVFYEDLVRDYRSEIREICDFLNEPYTKSLENWIDTTNIRESIHIGGKLQPVHTGAVGKWKRPEHRERVAEFMTDPDAVAMLRELGYSVP